MMAVMLTLQGRTEEAIREYQEILRRRPDDLDALNNVAWMRATHADASHRDGAEAVRLAESARAKSPTPEAVLYSTLAAAYAEAGRFPDAVSAGERAVELARAAGAAQEIERFRGQLRSYRAGKPFHFAK
jgi:tetratricopeptide (TPR) repeat protein